MTKNQLRLGIGKPISITVDFFSKLNNAPHQESIQGELIEVREDGIKVRQYIPYIEYLKGNKNINYIDRNLIYGEFTIISPL